MGESCSKHRRYEKCIQIFSRGPWKVEITGEIILKWILNL